MRHIHHRLHDLHALAAVLLIHVDELHVQLDGIDVGILEHIQRGIPAAEVVHHDREALAVQPLNGAFHHLGILGHHGLGDLSQQKLWLQLIFFHQICKDLRHIQVQDILHRNVHRHRYKVAAAFLPLLQGLADGFPDVLVQPCHKAGALQQRHELGGRNTAPGGVIPAHQRFHAHDGAGDAVTLGLQEEAEFVVVQCVLQLAQQLLLFFQLVEHGGLKAVQVAAVCRYTGDLRVVAQGSSIRAGVCLHGAHAHYHKEGDILSAGIHAGLQRGKHSGLLGFFVRQAQEKVIISKIAHRISGLLAVAQQTVCHSFQQSIALFGAVKLVIKLEVLDIHSGDSPFRSLMRGQECMQGL